MPTRRRCCCGGSIPGSCTLCVSLASCDLGHPVGAGATITVTKVGGGFAGTCTTSPAGSCCVDISAGGSGSYAVSGSKTGWAITPRTVAVTCPGTTSTSLTARPTAYQVQFAVLGCNGAGLPGATVTAGTATGTTDASGNVTLDVPDGTISYTVTCPPRFKDYSGSFTIDCTYGMVVGVTMTPADAYICCDFGGNYSGPIPVARTLHGADVGGAFSVTRSLVSAIFQGGHDVTVDNTSLLATNTFCPGACFMAIPPSDLATRTAGVAYELDLCGFSSGQVLRPGYKSISNTTCAACGVGPQTTTAWGSTDSFSLYPAGGKWAYPNARLSWAVIAWVLNAPPPAASVTLTFASDNWTNPGVIATAGKPPSASVTLTE